jgi:hypothetical protein
MLIGFGNNVLRTLTGISSNRRISLSILIGSENLYPVMHDPVVVLVAVPNISTKVICKDNLETSLS